MDLSDANLAGARLSDSNLEGANLIGANLTGAWLGRSRLVRATLANCRMDGAILEGAELQAATLEFASLRACFAPFAVLHNVKLDHATVMGTRFTMTDLTGAQFIKTDMRGTSLASSTRQAAQFEAVVLDEYSALGGDLAQIISLRSIDFAKLRSVLASLGPDLSDVFGDASVHLPVGYPRPAHWPETRLDDHQFRREWRKFLTPPAT